MVDSTDISLNASPSSTRRRWIAAAIFLFLLVQIWIPTSYYWSDEPTSERFAWRMFSSVDLSTWQTRVIALVERNGEVVEQEV